MNNAAWPPSALLSHSCLLMPSLLRASCWDLGRDSWSSSWVLVLGPGPWALSSGLVLVACFWALSSGLVLGPCPWALSLGFVLGPALSSGLVLGPCPWALSSGLVQLFHHSMPAPSLPLHLSRSDWLPAIGAKVIDLLSSPRGSQSRSKWETLQSNNCCLNWCWAFSGILSGSSSSVLGSRYLDISPEGHNVPSSAGLASASFSL